MSKRQSNRRKGHSGSWPRAATDDLTAATRPVTAPSAPDIAAMPTRKVPVVTRRLGYRLADEGATLAATDDDETPIPQTQTSMPVTALEPPYRRVQLEPQKLYPTFAYGAPGGAGYPRPSQRPDESTPPPTWKPRPMSGRYTPPPPPQGPDKRLVAIGIILFILLAAVGVTTGVVVTRQAGAPTMPTAGRVANVAATVAAQPTATPGVRQPTWNLHDSFPVTTEGAGNYTLRVEVYAGTTLWVWGYRTTYVGPSGGVATIDTVVPLAKFPDGATLRERLIVTAPDGRVLVDDAEHQTYRIP